MPDHRVSPNQDSPHGDRVSSLSDDVSETLHELATEIKPRLRGWLHAGILPLVIAAGSVLVVLSPGAGAKFASAIFIISALLLFGVSAVYHTGTWQPRVKTLLKRFDHSNIFLLIAGSYTAFSVLLLERRDATVLLILVWSGAVLGVAFRVLWLEAPRWLYVPVYIALGWAAVFWMPQFTERSPTSVVVLLIVGGLLYSLGALVYAFKRPDPAPAWFGFHEIFHSFTIAAFIVHYIGVSIAAYSMR
ncbi:MAG: hemolysin III family protein [Actinomycetota bacterium]|nr:hemolysin III family protein [Actinomycetota bacterium]MDQ3628444.1 hemolysin III family protein [Actinomycetota bacterium]